ncbi:MAG: 8-amino-7-oxononanoate synthase [Candidatus Omnitrophota bacterium]
MDAIERFLQERRENNLFRELRPADFRREGAIYFAGRRFLDFSSNDYLGLANHPELKQAAKDALEELGTGASASRLLSGDLEIHHRLEERIALFKEKESALAFNSGYQANVGIISALCKKDDAVFSDRLNHASILDGILLSRAKIFRFFHNDPNHLEYLLRKERDKFRNCLIVTETVFSMDGDIPPLKEIAGLKEKYDCMFMVDEAHATGVFGRDGSGLIQQEGLTDRVDLIMGTFGKALGSFGAYIAASKKTIDYLINTCRSFIYSTALPPAVIAANLAALELLKKEPHRREVLLSNAEFFRSKLIKSGFRVKGSSQIVPLIIGDTGKAIELSAYLENKGYWVLPIRPPTVPAGESRLRFSLTYHHTRQVLEGLIEEINKLCLNSWKGGGEKRSF